VSTTHQVDLSAGTIRYREAGEGPPIVFVHGLLVDGRLWQGVTPELERRFRCIVPDWPLGAHKQAMKPDADLTPRGVARLVAEFIEKLDLQEVTLVANDTGGAIAQLVVTQHPERIGRLVLTPCDAFDNFLPALFKPLQIAAKVPGGLTVGLQALRLELFRRLPIGFGWLNKHPMDKTVTEDFLRPFFTDADIRRDLRKFVRAIDKRDTQAAAMRLGEFTHPVLIVWASEDKVFPPDHARRLGAIFPDARVEQVADSYSLLPADQPARLAELITSFVGSGARDEATV
jgi:pimeloyl-ACP methyl ester carboxylesterase